MFSVIFEVRPRPEQWDAYLDNAKMLRPELEQVNGFVDNIRYKSLTREGWILSLSGWRDEKSVVRWRTAMRHHVMQEKGRSEILLDYHLRVGQITYDNHVPEGQVIEEQRLDETEVGDGTAVTFVNAKRPDTLSEAAPPSETAAYLMLDQKAGGLVGWDVYDGVLTPGDLILMTVWNMQDDAEAFEKRAKLPEGSSTTSGSRCARLRHVRSPRSAPILSRGGARAQWGMTRRRSARVTRSKSALLLRLPRRRRLETPTKIDSRLALDDPALTV